MPGAAVFRLAGGPFVVPVADHHDGFALDDSDRMRSKAAAMGPEHVIFGDVRVLDPVFADYFGPSQRVDSG